MNCLIQCPIGIDANDPHEFEQGTGRLAFYDIMGLSGHYREVCQECCHPMNEPVVDGGLELAPDLAIYSVWVGGGEVNDHALTPRQAIDLSYEWISQGYDDVDIDLYYGKSALELPSGYPEIIMRWVTSAINSMDYQEFGGDWWHTWRSPAGLHSYDINVYTSYDEDDTARVVVYDLTTTDEHGYVVTNTSSYYFIGNVNVSHMKKHQV